LSEKQEGSKEKDWEKGKCRKETRRREREKSGKKKERGGKKRKASLIGEK
jgi:hypothetical protein